MYNPVSTYRLQFHKDFTFDHLEGIIPYLEQLGIGAIYASPIFKAVPGSMHGYDGVDPLQISPEIGTLEQLRKISRKLKSKGIGWVQDIVPNHMAFHSDNAWLMDVLEKGSRSEYFNFFDITLSAEPDGGRIMVPFLGSELPAVIQNARLKVCWHNNKLCFDYSGNIYPLNLESYETVLKAGSAKQPEALAELLIELNRVVNLSDTMDFASGIADFTERIGKFASANASGKWFLQAIATANRDQALLTEIAEQQYYRLCSWQETDKKINYRRFFTVNGLICLNMQRPEVFSAFHELIGTLVKDHVFDGLRIDHIDGLYDPEKYLKQLREFAGAETFIAVEKILEAGEAMPANWPIQGNTGYDFLALINNVLTSRKGEAKLVGFYRELTGEDKSIQAQIAAKKRAILTHSMAGEWDNLTRLFISLELAGKKELGAVPVGKLKEVIGEFLVACPVYRFYGNAFPLGKKESKAVSKILTNIESVRTDLRPTVGLLRKALLGSADENKSYQARALKFYQRCMQFTGPLMAKGVEDTLMYTNSHFIAHNEVGDSPEAAGLSIKDFHQAMVDRQRTWSLSMNGTATHDTKRGEDVRARLQVLPDVADEWLELVGDWQDLTLEHPLNIIADNDAYFVYQTLLGASPVPGEKPHDFQERLDQYLEKTLREGKEHSNWAEPDLDYEAAVKAFAKQLLIKKSPFRASFEGFFHKVADFGILNSLAQVMLKFTCPGVPDIYQGCEHWDLSLVDPDNRRPVDYQLRKKLLAKIRGVKDLSLIKQLWDDRFDGRIKTWLNQLLAAERKLNPVTFEQGSYLPLKVKGKYKDHLLAFARNERSVWYLVAVPLGMAALVNKATDLSTFNWEDTRIILPENAPENIQNLLSGTPIGATKEIRLKDLFDTLPLALLKLTSPENPRGAGILLPLASLPSPFGIGDLGPQAREFAGSLHKAGQKYWQMLPLNPVSADQQFSPYSSYASFAGNEWYISPELLVEDGLLTAMDLEQFRLNAGDRIDYRQAANIKGALLDKAWANYQSGRSAHLANNFRSFCRQEDYWLTDFALYAALRQFHKDKPWYQWADEYKFRDGKAMDAFIRQQVAAIKKSKWLQFIFTRQLTGLKEYCNRLNVQLFGDLPFYVSYDSADVWANRELFSLDQDGGIKYVAGVPPDYFNADGQLWGMPVFNWDKFKERKFDWWIQRIKKNLQYFDLLRLDHFRAFASYWAVPAAEKTAINGTWLKAPGTDFFEILKSSLGELPLVAEDLGDIDAGVYLLRDQFKLPGMKVLQFAWGNDMPASPHAPHNYNENFIAYTGTHDNNTTRGWFSSEADKKVRKNLRAYTGRKVKSKDAGEALIKLAMASVARIAIIPLQDWLNLDETARLNTPAAIVNNWLWRLSPEELNAMPWKRISKWTAQYNRA